VDPPLPARPHPPERFHDAESVMKTRVAPLTGLTVLCVGAGAA
jgi:hypothetical protein